MISTKKRPCLGCRERYAACQDTCTKPEHLQERETLRREHEGRIAYLGRQGAAIDSFHRAHPKYYRDKQFRARQEGGK